MTYVKWTFRILVLLIVAGLLHYTLPQHDVVRITGTEVIRQDFTGFNRFFYAQPDSGNTEMVNRDLRLINTVQDNGRVMVYRNEDTGFGWPFYFKVDSSNLQAEAQNLISTKDNPQWVVVTHYGWRNEILSIYPNAVGLRAVDGPDVTIIPWFNIFFFVFFGALVLWLWRLWRRFRRRNIDPVLENVGDAVEAVDAKADAARDKAWWTWHRFRRWLDTWRG